MKYDARFHGTRACYQAGCRRPECRAANARYCKRYYAGQRVRVDVSDAIDMIAEVLHGGRHEA